MLDQFIELGDDLSSIDGPLLVLLRGPDVVSDAAATWFVRRIRRLSDRSEFWAAIAHAGCPHGLTSAVLPAAIHLFGGRIVARCDGIDEIQEFVEDFITGNRLK